MNKPQRLDPRFFYLRGMEYEIPTADVIRFEGLGNYTRIYIRGQRRPLLYGYTIGTLCARFPFMARVTVSVAVNPAHVERTGQRNIIRVGAIPVRLSKHYTAKLPGNALAL
ncbi:hypothetical protein [Fibrella forsythiae]|uniref:HTH LytTR-type domain-containing protein n=1 Tax=Fibrella forsythiae TaxID=2817061 RepID=A0ABS3JC21_9BACT|nr:hypothetical protein [Fibrella forsythiae]MBO0947544.1 hypothetical protein [Fibrella forsythiae]